MPDPLRRVDALVDDDTLPSPRIRQHLRVTAGLTQAEVAHAIGVKRVAVARWEAGLTKPHRSNRLKYAHFLRRLAEKYPATTQEASDED